jgi:hypothetical protein
VQLRAEVWFGEVVVAKRGIVETKDVENGKSRGVSSEVVETRELGAIRPIANA